MKKKLRLDKVVNNSKFMSFLTLQQRYETPLLHYARDDQTLTLYPALLREQYVVGFKILLKDKQIIFGRYKEQSPGTSHIILDAGLYIGNVLFD